MSRDKRPRFSLSRNVGQGRGLQVHNGGEGGGESTAYGLKRDAHDATFPMLKILCRETKSGRDGKKKNMLPVHLRWLYNVGEIIDVGQSSRECAKNTWRCQVSNEIMIERLAETWTRVF